MNLMDYAKAEFKVLEDESRGKCPDEVPIILEYKRDVLRLIKRFARSGQSGGSAPYTAAIISQLINNLCLYKPLSGINDTPEEWNKIGYADGMFYQHRRLGSVFKEIGGRAYYLDAIVFKGQDEYDTFTGTGSVDGINSAQYIKSWPFTPKTFYIDVVREQNNTDQNRVICGDGSYLYHLKDLKQLEEVWKYYDMRVTK